MSTFVLRRAPGSPALPPGVVRRIADAMLAELGLEHAELSVLLTNDREIQALNRRHRAKDRPTDVLAFPLDTSEASTPGPDGVGPPGPRLLGDVVVSLDTAARQARGRKRELLPEVRFLLAHGILHLIGYDHGTPVEKQAMDAMTHRLVRAAARSTTNLQRIGTPASVQLRGGLRRKAGKTAKHRSQARARHAK